jgi:hypothetical protein
MQMKLTESEIARAVADGFAEAGVDPHAHPGLIAGIVADTPPPPPRAPPPPPAGVPRHPQSLAQPAKYR